MPPFYSTRLDSENKENQNQASLILISDLLAASRGSNSTCSITKLAWRGFYIVWKSISDIKAQDWTNERRQKPNYKIKNVLFMKLAVSNLEKWEGLVRMYNINHPTLERLVTELTIVISSKSCEMLAENCSKNIFTAKLVFQESVPSLPAYFLCCWCNISNCSFF